MPRLIEVQDAPGCPSPLTVHPGDLLWFHASGGRVRSGGEAIEMLGPFLPAVLGDNGEILSPAGSPNAILFLARRPGRASVETVSGDPFHSPRTARLSIIVEP